MGPLQGGGKGTPGSDILYIRPRKVQASGTAGGRGRGGQDPGWVDPPPDPPLGAKKKRPAPHRSSPSRLSTASRFVVTCSPNSDQPPRVFLRADDQGVHGPRVKKSCWTISTACARKTMECKSTAFCKFVQALFLPQKIHTCHFPSRRPTEKFNAAGPTQF